MPSDSKRTDAQQDIAVAGTFPASDPPAGTADAGNRAVPPQEMMGRHAAPPPADAVTLRRRFPTNEAAKLALEGLVRDAPIDRDCATMEEQAGEVELRIVSPPGDAARLRALLARA
jgi:hypothetical protein